MLKRSKLFSFFTLSVILTMMQGGEMRHFFEVLSSVAFEVQSCVLE